ncbi:hypothetical protein B0J14DRAFT_282007 [Halenospora varia]|nr:hypothetical protein B0J14DRAFT_282007 [Halenospora varia]
MPRRSAFLSNACFSFCDFSFLFIVSCLSSGNCHNQAIITQEGQKAVKCYNGVTPWEASLPFGFFPDITQRRPSPPSRLREGPDLASPPPPSDNMRAALGTALKNGEESYEIVCGGIYYHARCGNRLSRCKTAVFLHYQCMPRIDGQTILLIVLEHCDAVIHE